MRQEANDTRDELVRYIEKELGWDVTMTRADEDDRYEDEPVTLQLEIRCEKAIERSNSYRVK